jgi:hypothetical protein
MIDHGVNTRLTFLGLPHTLPTDYPSCLERLKQPIPSVTPTNPDIIADFNNVCAITVTAPNEHSTTRDILEYLEGSRASRTHYRALNVHQNNYLPLIPSFIRFPQPDLYDGARAINICLSVRQALNLVILPSASLPSAPMASNFNFENKGPTGQHSVAIRQLALGLAYAARGIHALLRYGAPSGGKPRRSRRSGGGGDNTQDNDDASAHSLGFNRALSFGASLAHGNLKLLMMHMVLCGDDHPYPAATPSTPRPLVVYVMTQLRGIDLTDSVEAYCDGLTAFRNIRELAREVRDEAISVANARADAMAKQPAFASSDLLPRTPLQQGHIPSVKPGAVPAPPASGGKSTTSTKKRKPEEVKARDRPKRSRGSKKSDGRS